MLLNYKKIKLLYIGSGKVQKHEMVHTRLRMLVFPRKGMRRTGV